MTTLQTKEKRQIVEKYGKGFVRHVETTLNNISAEIDFHLCDFCGEPFPRGFGVLGEDREACCEAHAVLFEK